MQLKSKKKMKLFTFFLLFYENILIKHREDENLMYRKFISQLRQWEEANIKEPLLVIGARQVGKKWLIKEFCRNVYQDYVYINFEERDDFASAFDGSLSPEDAGHSCWQTDNSVYGSISSELFDNLSNY